MPSCDNIQGVIACGSWQGRQNTFADISDFTIRSESIARIQGTCSEDFWMTFIKSATRCEIITMQ